MKQLVWIAFIYFLLGETLLRAQVDLGDFQEITITGSTGIMC